MLMDRQWRRLLALCTLVAIGLPAWADDASSAAQAGNEQERVARLEALLETQQAQLEQLQESLAAARAGGQDAARADAMKQQIREVLSEQEFRESLMPSMLQAGYDDGFFIKSSDENFLMKINGRIQFRWTHYDTQSRNHYLRPRDERNDRTGFDIQRLRLSFKGHAYTEDLTYRFELRGGVPYNFRPHYAWVDYRFCDAFHFMAGMFKIAATRAQMTSSADLQFVDRPMTDAVFQLDRGVGVRFWGRLFDKRLDWYLDVVNSFDGVNNRTITTDPAEMDNNPGLVFHAVWHALGEDPGMDLKEQADLKRLAYPALDLGFHYAFNEDEGDTATTRIPFPIPRRPLGVGGFGNTNTNGLQINQFGFESAFKYMGFSATGEYFLRIVDPRRAGRRPFAPWWLLTRQGDTTTMHGAYLQLGYMLPIPGLEDKLEAVARAGGISTLANGQEGVWEYAAGLNYYLEGNKVKLQTDVAKIYEVPIRSSSASMANVNDDALVWRVQLQVAF